MTNVNYCPQCGHKVNNGVKFCPDCGHRLLGSSVKDNHQKIHKREKILSKSPSKFKTTNIVLSIGFIGVILIYFITTGSKENEIIKKQPKVINSIEYPSSPTQMSTIQSKVESGKIIIPLEVVKNNKFVKFSYTGSGPVVPLLAYISEEGKVITAISMCEPCNSTTFHIKGDELICNSCGTTWDLNNMDAISGSCGKYPPDPIPSIVTGNEIQIDVSSVANWQRRI
ncbi:MAG: DUF2318 domain-containing protein [Ignavibacterium sp.]|jgi:uncharacterized membrane protein|nr:DUF2318 domain-containing protein [Ignavibacterium sp.]